MASRLAWLVPAMAAAAAGAVAARRIPGRRVLIDGMSRAVLAGPGSPAPARLAPGAPAPAAVETDPPPPEEPIPPQTGDGPGPNSPLDMAAPDWKASVKRAMKEFKRDRGTLTGAGMAFYWFLSIFPALLAFVGMLGVLHVGDDTINRLIARITSALPGGTGKVLTDAIANQKAGSGVLAALIGMALALWSASSGMVGMQMGLDVAYDVKVDRTFVKKRLVAFELLAAMLVLGGAATALIVFGAPLGNTLRDNLPFGSAFVVLWTVIRWVGGLVALAGLFATIYYVAPNRDSPRWVWVSPGGILAAAIWLAASVGFSIYVARFGKYAQTYGSLAGVAVLLFWLYLTAIAVVLGGELNAGLERQSALRNGQLPSEAVPATP